MLIRQTGSIDIKYFPHWFIHSPSVCVEIFSFYYAPKKAAREIWQALSRGALRRANLDSAPLHLGRGLSPYGKTEGSPRKNASTFHWGAPPCCNFGSALRASPQSRAFALCANGKRLSGKCKHFPESLFPFARTAHCYHESSNFPVYNW